MEKVFAILAFAVVATAAGPLSLAPTLAEEHVPRDVTPLPDDLVALQGIWECRQRRPEGEFRIVKVIEGNAETYRVYRDGALTLEHRADISVAQEGPVKVFRWHNAMHQLTPRRGREILDGGYAYRLDKDVWTCVFGILVNEPESTFALQFRRVPPGEEAPPAEPKEAEPAEAETP